MNAPTKYKHPYEKKPNANGFCFIKCFLPKQKAQTAWRDTLNGVSRQFYSPAASSIACAVIFGLRREVGISLLFSLPICVIMRLTKSLPPGGRWHAKRDGRSLRDFEVRLTLW